MIHFRTFIVSYLFVRISSATSEKLISSSSERHLRFLWEGARERTNPASEQVFVLRNYDQW